MRDLQPVELEVKSILKCLRRPSIQSSTVANVDDSLVALKKLLSNFGSRRLLVLSYLLKKTFDKTVQHSRAPKGTPLRVFLHDFLEKFRELSAAFFFLLLECLADLPARPILNLLDNFISQPKKEGRKSDFRICRIFHGLINRLTRRLISSGVCDLYQLPQIIPKNIASDSENRDLNMRNNVSNVLESLQTNIDINDTPSSLNTNNLLATNQVMKRKVKSKYTLSNFRRVVEEQESNFFNTSFECFTVKEILDNKWTKVKDLKSESASSAFKVNENNTPATKNGEDYDENSKENSELRHGSKRKYRNTRKKAVRSSQSSRDIRKVDEKTIFRSIFSDNSREDVETSAFRNKESPISAKDLRSHSERTGRFIQKNRMGFKGSTGSSNSKIDEQSAVGGTTVPRRRKRKEMAENDNHDGTATASEIKDSREIRTKAAYAADGGIRGMSREADEEGKPFKEGEKQRSRGGGGKTRTRDGALNGETTKIFDENTALNFEGQPKPSTICDVGSNPRNPIEYQLSDERYARLGWTVMPVTRTMRRVVLYQASPAKPHLDWFKTNRYSGGKYYDNGGTQFLRFHSDGNGEVFYPNGKIAIRVQRVEEQEYDIYTVFTPGGKDSLGIQRDSTMMAIFDNVGNGAVFDENGSIRLSYNQIGGIYAANREKLPYLWTWHISKCKPEVQVIYKEKKLSTLENLTKLDNEWRMDVITGKSSKLEFIEEELVDEEDKEKTEFGLDSTKDIVEERLSPLKTICLKLNEYLSLRIRDQKNIGLKFLARNRSIRIELGTVLNFRKKVSSYLVDTINWKSIVLRCRFLEAINKDKFDDSLSEFATHYRKLKKFARERQATINKYRLFQPESRCPTFCCSHYH